MKMKLTTLMLAVLIAVCGCSNAAKPPERSEAAPAAAESPANGDEASQDERLEGEEGDWAEDEDGWEDDEDGWAEEDWEDEEEELPYKDFMMVDEYEYEEYLSDYIGFSCVVVNFWASWCPPCKQELPDFKEVEDEYAAESVVILMVNLADGTRETIETATEYLEEEELYFDYLFFDTTGEAQRAYAQIGIPTTVIFDENGNITKTQIGVMSKSALIKEIEKNLEAAE